MGINDQGKKSLTDKRDVYGVSTALVTMCFLALEPAEGLKAEVLRCPCNERARTILQRGKAA